MSTPPEGDRRTTQGFWEASPSKVDGQLDRYRIIDVRQPDEFDGPLGHIAGSELVPLGELEDACETWDHAQPLLLVCRSGARSQRACMVLMGDGFAETTNLTGGMMAWNQAGLPVTRG